MKKMENSAYSRLRPENLKRVLCRPALPKDTADVMELTRTIWDGNDYVPQVWEKWLADPDGLLAIAEYGEKVVGLAKLTRLEAQEWWLEGLRVHPEFEGRGIASHLNDYLLAYWEQHCQGVIRLATGSHRLKVHHLCERNGFQRVAEFAPFSAPIMEPFSPDEQVTIFRPLQETEIQEALKFIQPNPLTGRAAGLMNLGWQWAQPSARFLLQTIQRDRAWWWRGKTGLLLVAEDDEDQQTPIPVIQLIACPFEKLGGFLLDYQRLMAFLGYTKTSWVAPLSAELQETLSAAGFYRDWELSIYIYEKTHPDGYDIIPSQI